MEFYVTFVYGNGTIYSNIIHYYNYVYLYIYYIYRERESERERERECL